MKAVILAGGQGSRLSPLTDITNKFLMPVWDKLMIEYSIYSLKEAGITEICIVLGTKSAGETIDYLQSGAKYGVHITYVYQDKPLGVPHAINQARNFVGNDNFMVLCADNIMFDRLGKFVELYNKLGQDAFVTTKDFLNHNELSRFAVFEFKSSVFADLPTGIVEKPLDPQSNIAFCGIQIYNYTFWQIFDDLTLSERGEYEITDVLREYIGVGELGLGALSDKWFDCGNKESLFKAQEYAYYRSVNDMAPES